MQHINIADDIISSLKNGYTIHNIEDYIKEKYNIKFLTIIGDNEIYFSDENFSYVISVEEEKLTYMENNIICESCNGDTGFYEGDPHGNYDSYPCQDCNTTELNNFYTKGEFILRSK